MLEKPEVIIVPDRSLYKVSFAALSEKEGVEYLSKPHRICVIPSLTTLKIIQDSPEDYDSNTGALCSVLRYLSVTIVTLYPVRHDRYMIVKVHSYVKVVLLIPSTVL